MDGGGWGGFSGMPVMANLFRDQLIHSIVFNIKTDPKITEILGMAMGGDKDNGDNKPVPTPKAALKSSSLNGSNAKMKKEEPQAPGKEEDDLSQLRSVEPHKEGGSKGNALCKSKKFEVEEVLTAYDETIALDPTNMTFYDKCAKPCVEAVKVGKAMWSRSRIGPGTTCDVQRRTRRRATWKRPSRCTRRCSWRATYDKATEQMKKNMELEKKNPDAVAYHDGGAGFV
ncbi:hypothetical protein ACHAWF_018157 [Thalassiosira exigua]